MADCTQTEKQSLAADSTQGPLLHTALQGRSLHWTAACIVCLPSEPDLIKEFRNIISTNRTQAFTIQWELCSYIPHHIHQPIRNALFWPIRTVPFEPIKLWGFGVLICVRTGQSGIRSGTFLLYVSSPPARGAHFPFPLKSAFPGGNTEGVLRDWGGVGGGTGLEHSNAI